MQRAFFSQKLQQKPTHLLFPCTFNHDGARTQTHLGSLWVCFSLRLVCVEACVRVKNVRLVWTRDLRCVFTPQAASKRIFCPFFLSPVILHLLLLTCHLPLFSLCCYLYLSSRACVDSGGVLIHLPHTILITHTHWELCVTFAGLFGRPSASGRRDR